MRNYIILLLGIVGLFSCEKVLELDSETKTSKLVVNSIFDENTLWVVNISRSLSVLDDGHLSEIDNATVNLFDENNDFIQTMVNFGNGGYRVNTSRLPRQGKKYKLEVSASGYPSVTAKEMCPNIVSIQSIDTSSSNNSFGEKEYTTTIKFQDPLGDENFYGVEIELNISQRVYNSVTSQYDTVYVDGITPYLQSNNPILDNGEDGFNQVLTFNDKIINGQQTSISFSYLAGYNNSNYIHQRTMRFFSYSKATYNYLKSIEAYRQTEGNPFAEPVQVYSNIEGGFGIFGGQSVYKYKF